MSSKPILKLSRRKNREESYLNMCAAVHLVLLHSCPHENALTLIVSKTINL